MYLPGITSSSAVYLDYTDNFEGAADGWSGAETIGDEQRQKIAEARAIVVSEAAKLRVAEVLVDEANRAAIKARAVFSIRDIILDQRIMSASDALLNGPANRNREHPVYRQVFKEGAASDITGAKLREEPELAQRVLERFDATPEFDGKAAVRKNLADAVQKSLSTRDAVDEAEMNENRAVDAELAARLRVRTALEQAYGMLRTAFPGQRRFAESFFLKRERASSKAEGGESKPSEGGAEGSK